MQTGERREERLAVKKGHTPMPQEPVFVVVAGGVVKDAPRFVEVINVDDLLDEPGEIGQTKEAWEALSAAAQEYLKTYMAYEYDKIQARIQEDEEQSQPVDTTTDPADFALEVLNEIQDAHYIDCNCDYRDTNNRCAGTCTASRITKAIKLLTERKQHNAG